MKIVNRQEFLALPSGTLYAKYRECCIAELTIKTSEPIDDKNQDFYYKDLLDTELCGGELIDLFDKTPIPEIELNFDTNISTSRDGFFDQDQLFAVLTKEEHRKLIQLLLHYL